MNWRMNLHYCLLVVRDVKIADVETGDEDDDDVVAAGGNEKIRIASS